MKTARSNRKMDLRLHSHGARLFRTRTGEAIHKIDNHMPLGIGFDQLPDSIRKSK